MPALCGVWNIGNNEAIFMKGKTSYRRFCVSLVFSALLLAGGRVEEAHAVSVERMAPADSSAVAGLPLPSVPPTLRTVPERAAYVLAHFWDGMDFRDTLRSRNRAFMEQHFADFLSLFPHADTAALAPAVHRLMVRAESDRTAYGLLAEMAEKYLYEWASPMVNEEYFILFLEELVRTPMGSQAEKARAVSLLEVAKKNRRGSVAADFTYLSGDGKKHTLHGTACRRLLMVFYDPDCAHCWEVLAEIAADAVLDEEFRTGRLTLLAVDAEGDRSAWTLTRDRLPDEWLVGFDADGAIHSRALYVMPSMPALYLLDGDKRVLLKDTTLEAIVAVCKEKDY